MKKKHTKIITVGGKEVKVTIASRSMDVKSISDAEGIVEAYVSVFDVVDSYGDVVVKGAFAESLERKLPKVVYSHDWKEIIGKVVEAKEDDHGLLVKMKLTMEVQRARETFALLRDGAIDEFSFGYTVEEKEVRDDGVTVLKKVNVYEVSPVLMGANPETEPVSIKSAEKDDGDTQEKEAQKEKGAEAKGDVQDIIDERTKREKKWEKFREASEIFDAFWSAYFDDASEVDDFDALLSETLALLQELIGSGQKSGNAQLRDAILAHKAPHRYMEQSLAVSEKSSEKEAKQLTAIKTAAKNLNFALHIAKDK